MKDTLIKENVGYTIMILPGIVILAKILLFLFVIVEDGILAAF